MNVKNPTKPYSAPPYIQEKTDKIVRSFLLEYYKNLKHYYGAQKIWCVWNIRRRISHFITSGSEVRDYHKVKLGLSGRRGDTVEQDMLVDRNQLLDVFGVFICYWISRACMGCAIRTQFLCKEFQ